MGLVWGQVVLVVEVCRHGSRSPLQMFPWDEDGRWESGPGQLTDAGWLQHSQLGSKMRQRYAVDDPLLSASFDSTQVYIRSTDYNRTIRSAESQVQGLYPELTIPAISELMHVIPGADDFMLRADKACSLLSQHFEAVYYSPETVSLMLRNSDLLQTTSEMLGSDPMQASLLFSKVVDNLICNQFAGNPLPPQATETYMQKAVALFNELFALPYQSDENARLYSSAFFLELSELLQGVENQSEPSKFRLYSAHDTTVAGILAGLQVYDHLQPPFASSLIFEVSAPVNSEYQVRVEYNDQTMAIPGCADPCSVSVFLALLRERVYPDLQQTCEQDDSKSFLR